MNWKLFAIVVLFLVVGAGITLNKVKKHYHFEEQRYDAKITDRETEARKDFEDWMTRRPVERKAELLRVLGGDGRAAVKYPGWDIPSMLREMVELTVPGAEVTVGVDRFSEIVVSVRYAKVSKKEDCARDASRILSLNSEYIYDLVMKTMGNHYYLDRDAILSLAAQGPITPAMVMKKFKRI